MKSETSPVGVPRPALLLGIAGLLPFWGLAVFVPNADPGLSETALRAQMTYGALILSFLGGVHWGLAAVNRIKADWLHLGWGVTPSLVAWGALFLPPVTGLCVLIFGFVAAGVIDFRIFNADNATVWFARLRTILTIGAVSALLFTLATSAWF